MKTLASCRSFSSVSSRSALPEIAASICPTDPGFPCPYCISSRARRLWAWGRCCCASFSCPPSMPSATIRVCATHTREPARSTRYSQPPKQPAVRLARSTSPPLPSLLLPSPPTTSTPASTSSQSSAGHMPDAQAGPLPGARPRHPMHSEQQDSSVGSNASVCTPRIPALRFASSHASTMLSSESTTSSDGSHVSGASVHPNRRQVAAIRSDTTTRVGSPSPPLSARWN